MSNRNDRFRQNARKVDAGLFALDEARAQEKLARYQLPEPRHYVLEFVKTAHILGASTIDFQIEPGELTVWFDAHLPEQPNLDDISGAIFRRRLDETDEAIRHLAIGYHAADRLRLRDFQIASEERDGRTGTTIVIRERRRPAHLIARLRGLGLTEENVLRELCAYATAEISINGESIRQPFPMPPEVHFEGTIDDADARARVGVLPLFSRGNLLTGRTTRVVVVHQGVIVYEARRNIPYATGVGIVHARHLHLDLSQSHIVADLYLDEVLSDVIPAALLDAVSQHVHASYHGQENRPKSSSLRGLLDNVAAHVHERRNSLATQASNLGEPPEALRRHRLRAAEDKFRAMMRTAPIFPPAVYPPDGGAPTLSVDQCVAHEDSTAPIAIATETFQLESAPTREVILLETYTPQVGLRWLARDRHLRDITDSLRNLEQREENIRAWRLRPSVSPGLDRNDFPNQRGITVQGITVIVGKMASRDRHNTFPTLDLIKEGSRLLPGSLIMAGTVYGVRFQFSGDFEADERFSSTAPSPAVAAAGLAACRLVAPVLLPDEPPEVVHTFFERIQRGGSGLLRLLNHPELADQDQNALMEGLVEFLRSSPVPGLSPEQVRAHIAPTPSEPVPEPRPEPTSEPPTPHSPSTEFPYLHALRSLLGEDLRARPMPGGALWARTDDDTLTLNTSHRLIKDCVTQDRARVAILATSALTRLATPDNPGPRGLHQPVITDLRRRILQVLPE